MRAPKKPDVDPSASVPKLCGADVELGNFIRGRESTTTSGTGRDASRLLLSEIAGIPGRAVFHGGSSYHSQDWGRLFLPDNGGCIYIDLNHLEVCIPECLDAFDHVATHHAMLRIAEDARKDANAKLPPDESIVLLANNSDGQDHSYGSHRSFLMTRDAWQRMFHRRYQELAVVASFLASGIVITGAGKVGRENHRPDAPFQISQRADFFECVSAEQTTFFRPIVNARDESHAPGDLARLHVIFFDHTLCHVSSVLAIGTLQILLAMLEQECAPSALQLEDPVAALERWSPDLESRLGCPLVDGSERTAVELQREFFAAAAAFVEAGGTDGIVPRAKEIIAEWDQTLTLLEARDWEPLSRRLDWVLKWWLLDAAREEHSLEWNSPALRQLDQLYSSLDPDEGLYWACERAEGVETLFAPAAIERRRHVAPTSTRASVRAHLLERLGPERIWRVDWSVVEIDAGATVGGRDIVSIDLEDPLLTLDELGLDPHSSLGDTFEALAPHISRRKQSYGALPPSNRSWPSTYP